MIISRFLQSETFIIYTLVRQIVGVKSASVCHTTMRYQLSKFETQYT